MKIAVFGAGSIGVYVGASLRAASADVVLIGRKAMATRIAAGGVLLTDLHGGEVRLDGRSVSFADDPAALAGAELILVTVKSADTRAAALAIKSHATPGALVLSLQNGIGNADVLKEVLSDHEVIGGMVPFNVVQMPGNRFHRGTTGELMVAASASLSPWKQVFHEAHLPLTECQDFLTVQWGKLLLNLNNPVNALSGLPLKSELSQRAYRRCLALLIDEALEILAVAGIEPAKVARIAPRLLPRLLRLPDFLFTRVAASMLRIDPEARSSMWEDMQAGRKTEIDYLNGALVKLAVSVGRKAPANERIVALVRIAEEQRHLTLEGKELLNALKTGASTLVQSRSLR